MAGSRSWNVDAPTQGRSVGLVKQSCLALVRRAGISQQSAMLGEQGRLHAAPGKPSLFKPAFFLVILLRAGMQRGGKAVLHHLRRVQIGEGRVQRLELVEILENRL